MLNQNSHLKNKSLRKKIASFLYSKNMSKWKTKGHVKEDYVRNNKQAESF